MEHKNLYKFTDKKETSQTARRAKLLEEQKKRREKQYSASRNEESEEQYEPYYRINENYRNCLMLSEWMTEVPDDLEDFVLVPCPKGWRCSFVVKSNKAALHYKNGKEFKKGLSTNIPKNTVLDCFYVEKSSTLYILDVLKYKGRDVIDCDYSFRSYWIRTKFDEDDLKFLDDNITLKMIEIYDFNDPFSIQKCYEMYPIFSDETELDGFLYYHKEGSYTFGETPLVLWLFPFMVEEVMPTYKIHPHYNSLKPNDYENYQQYITDFNAKMSRKGRRSKEISGMDCETSTETIEDPIQQTIELETYGCY